MCRDHRVLFVADEIQTGIARTGRLLATCGNCACQNGCEGKNEVKPDMLILGKALSGGVLPVSAVLANDEVMLTIQPGEHGSTFGGNPLACAVAMEALQVVKDEKLAENAQKMGEIFRAGLQQIAQKYPIITTVRGKGLLNAIVIDTHEDASLAWDLCMKFAENGLLAKPTHGNKIRLAPPLVITESQIKQALRIIEKSIKAFV
jgi:ornithine--oxo-acid transaminase